MSQPQQAPTLYTEADVQLAISDISRNQIQSIRRAEKVYKVPERTIRRRRDGTRSRRDCEPNEKRLTKLEEEVVVLRILKDSAYSLPSSKADVQDIANRLLCSCNAKPVSKNWVNSFIKCTPKLQKR